MSSSEHNSQRSPSPMTDCQRASKTKKRAQRVSRACDFCHTRSIRCRPNNDGRSPCQSCVEYQRQCTYDRPSKKRGVKSNAFRNSASSQVSATSALPTALGPDLTCAASEALDHDSIRNLAEIYFETIYPIFPLFHRQTLLRRIDRREYAQQAPFFACVQALSALVIARVRDGALFSDRWQADLVEAMPSSSTVAAAAQLAIPLDARAADSLDYLRAVHLLALTSMQNGLTKDMHMWVGVYHMLVRVNGLRDEDNWPVGLGIIELEERRRVFWSMYNLEVFCGAVFDTPLTCREAENKVRYPSSLDDEWLDESEARQAEPAAAGGACIMVPNDPTQLHWIQGWNFITDLYRILEHAINRRREKESKSHPRHVARLFTGPYSASSDAIIAEVQKMFAGLPDCFKEVPSMTFVPHVDRIGFQSANIAATMQLVRITLYSPEVATDEQRCDIVKQVVHTFAAIPIGFLKAINTPLLYHLGGIGIYLGSVSKQVPTDSNFNRCRETLLGLADLLSNLGVGTLVGEEPARRVRAQVDRMEAYMQAQMALSSSSNRTAGPRDAPLSSYSLGMHEDSTVMQYAPIEDFQVHDTKVYNTFPRCDTGALRNQDPQMGSYGSETRPILVSQAVPMPAAHFPTAQYGFSPGMLEDWPWAHELRKPPDDERRDIKPSDGSRGG